MVTLKQILEIILRTERKLIQVSMNIVLIITKYSHRQQPLSSIHYRSVNKVYDSIMAYINLIPSAMMRISYISQLLLPTAECSMYFS